jgi:hypothetical protein
MPAFCTRHVFLITFSLILLTKNSYAFNLSYSISVADWFLQ